MTFKQIDGSIADGDIQPIIFSFGFNKSHGFGFSHDPETVFSKKYLICSC